MLQRVRYAAMMQRKAVICGGGGQLGVALSHEFQRREWAVESFDRNGLDITNPAIVEEAITKASPQVVINAAAYNQVDIAEKEPLVAFEVNGLAVRNLARSCRQIGAKLVHYSTDYVFDGRKGSPYVESDTPHPLGAYGISKLAGEFYAQAYLEDPLVLRTSGVFGPGGMFTPRRNFVELMLRLAENNSPIRVVEDYVASPTYAPAMASRTADMIERDISGIFHLGGGQPISWYHFALMIFNTGDLSPSLTATNENEYKTVARRPKFSALSNSKLEAAGIRPMPPLADALKEYFELRKTAKAHRSA